MHTEPSSDRAFLDQQNKIRGLISTFKSRKFVDRRPIEPQHLFRSGLRQLLLESRTALPVSLYDDFLEWTHLQIESQLPELARLPVAYDELSGVITNVVTTSLERELRWITARIRIAAPAISAFRNVVTEIERLVAANDFSSALAHVEAFEDIVGASFWSIQLRIALEQLVGGLESQKRYTNSVRSVYKRGLLSFLAYHTSVRNEQKTTLAKYYDDINNRIDNHKYYDNPVRLYVKFRLTGELPLSESGIADVLRVEQSHSLMDVYETFVSVIHEIARREDLRNAQSTCLDCLVQLENVDDFRLRKAFISLGGNISDVSLPQRDCMVSDALLSGRPQRAALLARHLFSKAPVDVWQIVYGAFAFAHAEHACPSIEVSPPKAFRLLAAILRRSVGCDEAYAHLIKLCANFRALPHFAGLNDLLSQLRRESPNDPWRPWLVGLNSPTLGVEDVRTSTASLPEFPKGATRAVWETFRGESRAPGSATIAALKLARAAASIRGDRPDEAVKSLKSIPEESREPLRNLRAAMLLNSYVQMGDRSSVIEAVADEGSRGLAHRRFTPVVPALNTYEWADFKEVSTAISVPVALDLLWRATEAEVISSRLRFSTGRFLKTVPSNQPSNLYDLAHNFPSHQLIYFLRYVCVPQILDGSRVLKGSRQVLEERQRVCAILRLLDPSNDAEYEREIFLITNRLMLDDGQWIVDRSRIHVDVDALTRWAEREVSEDFARYLDLRAVSLDSYQNFDDVLKELAAIQSGSRQSLFVPDNEADAVLYSILHRMAEAFLTNSSFGLDFYLSKRIRHQSFIGFIRGPLEFSNIITTRETESGPYHANRFWVDKFSCIDEEAKGQIDDTLARCAAIIDDALLDAKDNRFHVRTDEKPDGIFYLSLNTHLFALVRAVIGIDPDFEGFVISAAALFWGTLSISLAAARKFILDDLKTRIAEALDELRADLRKIAGSDPAFLELASQIAQSSTEVQRALDEAATWFARQEIETGSKPFTLQQTLDVAIDTALKSQRAFEPAIERHFEGNLELRAPSLIFVHDVIFVALDNVRVHSGLKTPKVRISVIADPVMQALTLTVVSEYKDTNPEDRERKLKEIRALIETGAIARRTRREGGSGFLKLATVVKQSSKGSMDFGVSGENEFTLSVTYSLIMEQ